MGQPNGTIMGRVTIEESLGNLSDVEVYIGEDKCTIDQSGNYSHSTPVGIHDVRADIVVTLPSDENHLLLMWVQDVEVVSGQTTSGIDFRFCETLEASRGGFAVGGVASR